MGFIDCFPKRMQYSYDQRIRSVEYDECRIIDYKLSFNKSIYQDRHLFYYSDYRLSQRKVYHSRVYPNHNTSGQGTVHLYSKEEGFIVDVEVSHIEHDVITDKYLTKITPNTTVPTFARTYNYLLSSHL